MNTWPNRGASGGPCGGLEERENPKTQTPNLSIRSTRSDSSQQASAKPGVVHIASAARKDLLRCVASANRSRRDLTSSSSRRVIVVDKIYPSCCNNLYTS